MEDSIENILNEKTVEVPPVSVHVEYTFIDYILNKYHQNTEDTNDEEPLASQVNDKNDVVKNNVNIPHSEEEKSDIQILQMKIKD